MTDKTSGPTTVDVRREWRLLSERLDPIARDVIAAEDPLAAHETANAISRALILNGPPGTSRGRALRIGLGVTALVLAVAVAFQPGLATALTQVPDMGQMPGAPMDGP